jgi:hypothetical protein
VVCMLSMQLGAVTQDCNASYSGGRDQEDGGPRLAWAKTFGRSSQPVAGHGGASLSSQLCGRNIKGRITVQAGKAIKKK